MKQKLIFCGLAALMMAVTVSSCKKDDQPEHREVDTIQLEDVFRNTPGYQVAMTNGSTPDSYAGNLLMNGNLESSNGLTFAWAGLGVQILNGVAYQFGSQLMAKAFPAISDAIFGKGDQQDAGMQALKALDEIRGQLNVIDSKLDQIAALANEIMSKLEDMEFNQMYQYFYDFNGKVREMDLSCSECFNKMRPDMSEEELKAIVLKWGDEIVSGNQAPRAFVNMCGAAGEFQYKYGGQLLNLFATYDLFVYQTTPFESDGYDTRDTFRAAFAAKMANAAILSSLYYYYTEQEANLNGLDDYLQKLQKFFVDCGGAAVTRNTDKLICQIKGAQFEMPLDALYAKDYVSVSEWAYSSDLPFYDGNRLSGKENQLSDTEMKAISKYYAGTKAFSGLNNKSLLSIFEAHGVKLPTEYINGRISNDNTYFITSDYVAYPFNSRDSDEYFVRCDNSESKIYMGGGYLSEGNFEVGGTPLSIDSDRAFEKFRCLNGYKLYFTKIPERLVLAISPGKLKRLSK